MPLCDQNPTSRSIPAFCCLKCHLSGLQRNWQVPPTRIQDPIGAASFCRKWQRHPSKFAFIVAMVRG